MPRYFLHHMIDDSRLEDHEGHDLADLSLAEREAVLSVRAVQGNRLISGKPLLKGAIEITDEDGQLLATVLYLDAVMPAVEK